MKLIVNVPDELYNRIMNGWGWTCTETLLEVIRNGEEITDTTEELENESYPNVD